MKRRPIMLVGLGLLTLTVLSCSICPFSSGGNVPVTLVNQSSAVVCYVYISPVEDDTWGDDWLGSSEVVRPGERRTFDVPQGDYDLRADDCNHDVLDVMMDVSISGPMEWVVH